MVRTVLNRLIVDLTGSFFMGDLRSSPFLFLFLKMDDGPQLPPANQQSYIHTSTYIPT